MCLQKHLRKPSDPPIHTPHPVVLSDSAYSIWKTLVQSMWHASMYVCTVCMYVLVCMYVWLNSPSILGKVRYTVRVRGVGYVTRYTGRVPGTVGL